MHRLLASLAALGLGVGGAAAGGAPPPDPAAPDHAPLDRILSARVRDERVDYLLLRKHDRGALARYIDRTSRVEVDGLSEPERLALYFNLYNAVMIQAVIDRFRADYSPADRFHGVFEEPLVRIGTRTLSLNQLEHGLLRKRFREPRLHVALVCAARSCPPILPRAFRGDDLDAVLEDSMRRFVNDPTRNRIDRERRRLRLSRIFDWYAADFGGRDGVPTWIGRYSGAAVTGYAVDFLDYDWTLNVAPPGAGRWVEIAARRAGLRSAPDGGAEAGNLARGEVVEVLDERDGLLRVELPRGGTAWLRAEETRPYP